MKTDIIKIGLFLIGTAGVILLAPKKKEKYLNIKERLKSVKKKVKIEPEKLTFC